MKFNFKKTSSRIGLGFLVFLALLLLVRAGLNFINGKKLESYLQELKSRGLPLTLKDLEYACPPEDNAALYWRAAGALYPLWTRIQFDSFNRVWNGFVQGQPLASEKRTEIRKMIEENRDFLDLLRKAAAKPCYKYDDDWTKSFSELQIGNAAIILRGIKLLGFEAVLMADDGRSEEAISLCLDGIHLVQAMRREPFVISDLISVAAMRSILFCLQETITGREIPPSTLKTALEEIDPIFWGEKLGRTLRSVRIENLDFGLAYLHGDFRTEESTYRGIPYWLLRPVLWIIRPYLKTGLLGALRTVDPILSSGDRPYYGEAGFRKMAEDFDQIRQSRSAFFQEISSSLPSLFLKHAVLQATMQAMQLGIACKIFHTQTGYFPESLDQLAPGIIPEIPLDPFTGKPFLYKKDGTGYILYSFGSNEKDDGGRGNFPIEVLVARTNDDWAWREKAR
jgi:hypothetical protein